MGLGFRLNLKLAFPLHSHFLSNSPSRLSSSSVRGRESCINQTRLSYLSAIIEEAETVSIDPCKTYACASAVQTLENEHSQVEGIKMNVSKRSPGSLNYAVDDAEACMEESFFFPPSNSKDPTLRFSLLLENLTILEELFSDTDRLKLESDILLQLGKLGALNLFNTYLARTLSTTNVDLPTESLGKCKKNGARNDNVNEVIVRTSRKEERKSRRERASSKNGHKFPLSLPSKSSLGKPAFSSAGVSKSKSRRLKIARNEAEMSRGVKVLSDLENIRTTLEEGSGRAVTMSCWAEAAELDVKVLQQQLRYGWYCRDELIRSTRSLVIFLARNYRGMGIALEDLIQAGNLGVLQGAERFDHTRGYRFSTYVQYWIRKSMSKLVALHARGIQIPCALSRAMNQIQKARKSISTSHGRYPDDKEIAECTGLSLARIESASKCLRVVGSIDQKMGECSNVKQMEFIPDTSISNPVEAVTREHMIKDIHNLLRGLDSRERQVLILRYGLTDHQPKSLEEIGKQFGVSKEWVRRLQKKVTMRLKNEETCNLRYYISS
ncbi:RNA polymerase sigma factor sigC [Euphorbia lathyris]|uniref:RNA polymerase sigma factor sigC n=1 Tax=Euphorbia lathyris TaxID=212925 RepID=UPI003313B792